MDFDRYSKFRHDGSIDIVPFINIRKKSTDCYYAYKAKRDRLDIISYKFYGDPNFAWLILQANPELGSIENFIDDGTELRIPYPLADTLNQYMADIDSYRKLNG